jgi:hypothetical protein
MSSRAHWEQQVRLFIDGVGNFNDLALGIHQWQASGIIGRLVDKPAKHWQDIPAVPVLAFKHLDVGTIGAEAAVAFRTSGTSDGRPGVHRMRSTALYDYAATLWMRKCVPNAPSQVIALLPDDPRSSLSHMVAQFGQVSWHQTDGRVDVDRIDRRLAGLSQPVFVATTAFSLAAWLETRPAPLPSASVLMVTGGFKGRVTQLDHDALYALATRALRPHRLITEYGMTELSSQLWGVTNEPFRAPPWLRVLAVDPATGSPLSEGRAGQLRFVDLCNLDSSLVIDTLDLGSVRGDKVSLQGRLPGAPIRGCSLTAEIT